MSALIVQPPFEIFTDIDGQPLEAGYVWIGTANLDPQVNPITVYFDQALTILAPQPLRTTGGYIVNSGTPAKIYVDAAAYSIRVMNKNGSTLYTLPNGTGIDPSASGIEYDPPFPNSVPTTVEAKLAQTVSVKDFGAVGDGVADDTAAIQNALSAADSVYFPEGSYLTTLALRLTGGKRIFGDGKNKSFISRTNTSPETINSQSVTAAIYVSSRYNSIENIGIAGDRTGLGTTASVDGVYLGNLTETANNSSFANLNIRNANSCIRAGSDVFMLTFSQLNCANSVAAYNFSNASFKTSLTFNSCWSENCGQAYDFNSALYSVLNSCGADYANYTSTGNPYGFGFGSRSTSKGVYHFASSNVTINSCGAEQSYGDGVFKFNGNCQATLNSPNQDGCSSEFVPSYGTFGDVAVGPIQCDVGGAANVITINAPRGMSTWTNPAVASGHPTRPISQLLAFNYLEGTYGVREDTVAVITSAQGVGADLIKGIASSKYCVLIDSLKRNPVITGTLTQGGVLNRGLSISGTGTAITIPFISQSAQNYKNFFRIIGQNNAVNSNITRPFSAEIGVANLTSLSNVSSGNLFGISSVTISGLSLVITLQSSVTNPVLFIETISERINLIDFNNISIA